MSGVDDDGNFLDLSGYFFGFFRDNASCIISRHATPCRPVTDCKMNDLERLFDVKIRFWLTPLQRRTRCVFWSPLGHCTNLNEDRPILSATKM